MGKRITVITTLSNKSVNLIESMIKKTEINTCKMSYGFNNNRNKLDTLPYHFTIFACDKSKKEQLLIFINHYKKCKIRLIVNEVSYFDGNEDSFVLSFKAKDNAMLKNIQTDFYKQFKEERYNPEKFDFHLTIDIDKNENKIKLLQSSLQKIPPFEIDIIGLSLFEIYPAELIAKHKFI